MEGMFLHPPMRIESGTRQQVPDFFIFVENGGCMKTLFVLYMLTLIHGHSPQVTVLDTFNDALDCYDTVNELKKFYRLGRLTEYNAGLMTFMCIEKKVVKDDCKNPD